jgi:arginyl-tRNA synthetase
MDGHESAAGGPAKAAVVRPRVGQVGDAQRALARAISAATANAVSEGRLPPEAGETLSALGEAHLEVPRESGKGDFASTAGLRLAGPCRLPPRRIAEEIRAGLDLSGLPVDRTEVAGAGFLNFFLTPGWLNEVVARIRTEGPAYGRSQLGRGVKVQVEFVSANPTGPLGVVNARAAAVGDALAALLDAAGFTVEREYYVNDAGGQIERLGLSVEARWRELQGWKAEIPEGGYPGDYVIDIARAYEAERGDQARAAGHGRRVADMARFAVDRMVASHREHLSDYGVSYDVWFSQEALMQTDALDLTVADLEARGHVFRADGAVWLRTTSFGDDKDRVLLRSNGEPTYFLADIAYHRDKYARGFRHVIDLWGPDHHGYVPRMMAAVGALGLPPDALEVLIVQMVRLLEGGELAKMSKRRGQIVPMEDLLAEVGRDAARFFFLMRSADSHLDFDLDLAKHRSSDNPVYYVQYAHARICSILRQADAGSEPDDGLDLSLLTQEPELALIRLLADFPEEVAGAAFAREPHRLTRYASELAAAFHKFYDTCRVLTDEAPLRRARLALVDAARIVLSNVLGLCGVSAPRKM